MDTKSEFDLAISESLLYRDHLNTKRNDGKYYDDSYAEPIKKYFKDNGIESYEVNYSKRYKCTSICAFASSGRLCFLYFKPQNADFETAILNDLSNSRPTKMDAVIGNENYECKCQEIVAKSHTPLSVKYLESALFKEMGVKNYSVKTIEETDNETGKVSSREVLVFDVNELNIKLKGKNNYSNLHFDLKQLICHLIAIANNNKKKLPTKLKYIFFTPNNEVISRYIKVKKLYCELREEIQAILNEESSISKFAKDHNITLEINDSSFVQMKDVDDFVYRKAFKK
jgi:hypothetical protein